MWFFKYNVKFFDDEYGVVFAKGITVGETLNEACRRVTDWYGEKSIIYMSIKTMEGCEEGGILEKTWEKIEVDK